MSAAILAGQIRLVWNLLMGHRSLFARVGATLTTSAAIPNSCHRLHPYPPILPHLLLRSIIQQFHSNCIFRSHAHCQEEMAAADANFVGRSRRYLLALCCPNRRDQGIQSVEGLSECRRMSSLLELVVVRCASKFFAIE